MIKRLLIVINWILFIISMMTGISIILAIIFYIIADKDIIGIWHDSIENMYERKII